MKNKSKDPRLSYIEALAKAQLDFKPVEKTSKNPYYKSTYAPYEEVWASVGKPLNENGFAVIHQTRIEDGHFLLITRLMHKDGHEEYSEHEIVPEKSNNMQGKGSAETYSKRYNLVALTAVPVINEDDDGNAACAKEDKPLTNEELFKQKKELVDQIESLTLQLRVDRLADFEKMLKTKYKVNHVNQLNINDIKSIIMKLKDELRRQK